jgi:hypothetical protein
MPPYASFAWFDHKATVFSSGTRRDGALQLTLFGQTNLTLWLTDAQIDAINEARDRATEPDAAEADIDVEDDREPPNWREVEADIAWHEGRGC